MTIHTHAGRPCPPERLESIPALIGAYRSGRPDPGVATQRVAFGTSGHRGTSLANSFNEDHVRAICQAIAEHRRDRGVRGPLFLGMDTHALSEAAHATAVEVFAACGVELRIQERGGYTPTPVISHAILVHNRDAAAPRADGVVITPSHNPPRDGGVKYNMTHGGPANVGTTRAIEERANRIITGGLEDAPRLPLDRALAAETTRAVDFMRPFVEDLSDVVDMEAIAGSGLRLGVDPMGGAACGYWAPIAERYKLDLTVTNPAVSPDFRFVRLDHDGQIRMDCSSRFAMAGLLELKDDFDIAFGNDPDCDRHGIVTRSGLMNPNHYLAVAIGYLFRTRGWDPSVRVGKTLVSSTMIDRVADDLGRELFEAPVGFKWFVDGLEGGWLGFGGEESAGAAFLRRDQTPWTTDKDGFSLALLAAEITAVTGRDPSAHYAELEARHGRADYARIDVPCDPEHKDRLKHLSPDDVRAHELAGEPITGRFTRAPGNGAAIGGLKVVAGNGWFAARPSGTESVYKIYAESFKGAGHLRAIQDEAMAIVRSALG